LHRFNRWPYNLVCTEGRFIVHVSPRIGGCYETRNRNIRYDPARWNAGEGINLSVADKLRIAEKIDAFGIHYIEGGWPGSNPKDLEFFRQAARRKWRTAKIAAFSMTRRKNMPVEKDELMRQVLEAETPVVTIVGKTWLLHVTEVLRAKPDENLAMISDTIRFLKTTGSGSFMTRNTVLTGSRMNRITR